MNVKQKNKITSGFSMSGMTDMIFLLLIFFMLTSSFITPSGLPVSLPSSKSSKIVLQKTTVTISEDLAYYVNDQKVSAARLRPAIKQALTGEKNIVVLHIDKGVPVKHLVKVADIATSLEAKVSLATKPKE